LEILGFITESRNVQKAEDLGEYKMKRGHPPQGVRVGHRIRVGCSLPAAVIAVLKQLFQAGSQQRRTVACGGD
jgi:hypothetical protein